MNPATDKSDSGHGSDWFSPVRFGILLALLILAMFPQVLTGLQTFVVRDFGFFAYPAAHFQRDCFWRAELPLWNPYNDCGVPFLAQWNTMALYPPAVIYLALPLHWSLGVFCLLHLWFAGMGMYFLARRWTDDSLAGAFAGTAFVFNGLTLNLLMWPSHMATLAWMPWVVLGVSSAWQHGGRKIIFAALAGAMQMLAGGPEIIFFTWLLLLLFWIRQFIAGDAPRLAMSWRFPLMAALVVSLTLVQLLPFLDLLAHSQRHSGYADTRWSMPGWGWVNFLVPMAFGGTWTEGVFFQYGQYWTSSYYLGLATLWLAVLATLSVRDRPVRLLAVVGFVALVFAFGEHTPVYPALRKILPQLGFMTYPIKFVIVVVFVAPLLAAFALIRLQQLARRAIILGIVLALLLGGIAFWSWWSPFPNDDVHATLINALSRFGFLAVIGGLLLLLSRKQATGFRQALPLLLIAVAWLDVFTHEPPQNPTAPLNVYASGLAQADLKMDPQPAPGASRAMVSPAAASDFIKFSAAGSTVNYLAKRLGYCGNCNLLDDVPKIDGFFSLAPREIDDVLSSIYAATNTDYPGLENFLGVSQITAPGEMFRWRPRRTFLPLITAGQKPVYRDDDAALAALTRPDFDGAKTVYLPPDAKSLVTATGSAEVRIVKSHFEPQQIDAEVEVESPAATLVVFAQTYYHNWEATVDGKPAPLLRADYAFQAVPVPAGRHGIRLEYRDRAFELGALISGCMWINCLICLRIMRERAKSYGPQHWEPDSPF